jgi:hypothetical protein
MFTAKAGKFLSQSRSRLLIMFSLVKLKLETIVSIKLENRNVISAVLYTYTRKGEMQHCVF